MNILDSSYYLGPNIWSRQSGLCVSIDVSSLPAAILGAHNHELATDLRLFLADSLSIEISAAAWDALPRDPLPLLQLSLHCASALMRDYCTQSAIGRILDHNDAQLRLFIPCEDVNTAWFAWNLSIEAIFLWLIGTSETHSQLSDKYHKFRQLAQHHALDPAFLALAKLAREKGIPFYSFPETVILGQGIRQKRIDKENWQILTSQPSDELIDKLFPPGSKATVPIAGITGSLGKTTTCRMLAHILASTGQTVALSTTQGTYIGHETCSVGDSSSGHATINLMADPRVETCVAELARGGLARYGLGLETCDVGAVLNVFDNHIGIDGINSRQDLALIKRVVVENASKLAVLNADDDLCLAMQDHISVPEICLVSKRCDNPAVLAHLARGGLAAFLDGHGERERLKLCQGPELIGEIPVVDIPASWGGHFRPAIENALFASAMAHGMAVDFSSIRRALSDFRSNHENNPGRMNFCDDLGFKLIITWADGPQAIGELAGFARSLGVTGKRYLALFAMGNRTDDFILATAQSAAGYFTNYVCSDWEDLRGRPAGQVASLLAGGLLERGIPETQVSVADSHDDALLMTLEMAKPGDLVVLVTYSTEKAWHLVSRLKPPINQAKEAEPLR